jgi:hypothetical protein
MTIVVNIMLLALSLCNAGAGVYLAYQGWILP